MCGFHRPASATRRPGNRSAVGRLRSVSWSLSSPRTLASSLVIAITLVTLPPSAVADRSVGYFPLPADAAPAATGSRVATSPPAGGLPCDGFGDSTREPWRRYLRLWQAHRRDPSDPAIRQFLGLPADDAVNVSSRPGRAAPRELRWRLGSYRQVETPHFLIFSRADERFTRHIAEDLERCYWVWTQVFFPLWEGSPQVTVALDGLDPESGLDPAGGSHGDQDVSEHLRSTSARITTRRKLRVVLFRDADEYATTLAPSVPGVEQSTGYYHDGMGVTFLYGPDRDGSGGVGPREKSSADSAGDDTATRRHELVHQMFREATRSGLRRNRAGERADFWIVEGIAGYFESLWLGEDFGILGGWDSPRLQFARHRVLSGGERLPLAELRGEGRETAQRRADLPQWYAHAIAHTHRLLDGEGGRYRPETFRLLASLYRIRVEIADGDGADTNGSADTGGSADAWAESESRLQRFLRVGDSTLIANPPRRPLRELCLAGCEVSENGIAAIGRQPTLRWLDLSRLPIGDDDVRSLCPDPDQLRQLNLEATRITPELAPWLTRARRLTELDLSWTAADDRLIGAVASDTPLETLWLTGTRVGDVTIDAAATFETLSAVDVQRTEVTDAALKQLRRRRPDLQINPLRLVPE